MMSKTLKEIFDIIKRATKEYSHMAASVFSCDICNPEQLMGSPEWQERHVLKHSRCLGDIFDELPDSLHALSSDVLVSSVISLTINEGHITADLDEVRVS